MKFYKGDILQHKDGSITQFIRYANHSPDGAVTTKENYRASELKLIRRASEPEWPSDVPRCELPLPEGVRYAFTGYQHWSSPSQLFYWNGKWSISHGPVAGDPKLPTCKAVDDEDYVPPQLSETTNSSQVESKITVERSTMVKHADLHNVASVRIDGGKIFTHLNGLSISASQALALAELLTAAAKEAQQ